MNRRKAKKAFKKKWAQPGRCPLFRTVPNKYSPRVIDAVNEGYQYEIALRLDAFLIHGAGGPNGPEQIGAGILSAAAERGTVPYALAEIVEVD